MASASDDAPFAGRTALVTGASGGIGAELSRRLADAGAAVALRHASNEAAATALVAEIGTAGGRARTFCADLGDASAPERLVGGVERELGPVDGLAANAGLSRAGTWEDVDAEAFDETLAVNLRAPYLLARRVLPGMR